MLPTIIIPLVSNPIKIITNNNDTDQKPECNQGNSIFLLARSLKPFKNSKTKPIATKKQLNLLPHRFHVDLPEELIIEVVKCKDNTQVKQIGIEWCIEQSKKLKKAGIPVLHYYSMGKSDNIKSIASQVF